jgi:acyl-CoA reductase-like NAD-dependent aldehyde dehydrogenase
MSAETLHRSPGDLRVTLPPVEPMPVEPALARAAAAAPEWAKLSFAERERQLRNVQEDLTVMLRPLARELTVEVGKPIAEALGEADAIVGKFDHTLRDAAAYLPAREVQEAPHEAVVRQLPQGPAVVIAPFNLPLHLPNGAMCAHLAAGNPVILKPSPLAARVSAEFVTSFQRHLPPGVVELVQGGADEAMALCRDPRTRAICFTGSVAAGRAIAQAVAADFSKSLALELGGKNALIVCEDSNVESAARATAEGVCLTTGQRCNSTSRVIVRHEVLGEFVEQLWLAMEYYTPGDPLDLDTRLGPLVSAAAVRRFADAIASCRGGEWLVRGEVLESVAGCPGYYVRPGVVLWKDADRASRSPLQHQEVFAPLLEVFVARDDDEIVRLHNGTPYGLTASVFTTSRARFDELGARLNVGNLYANLSTTSASSILPFPAAGDSGNGKPAGRGFIRFTTQEQSVQIARGTMN